MFESYWRGAVEEITEDRLELESSPNSFPFQSYGLLKIMFCIHLNGTCKLYRSLKAFNIPHQNDPFSATVTIVVQSNLPYPDSTLTGTLAFSTGQLSRLSCTALGACRLGCAV